MNQTLSKFLSMPINRTKEVMREFSSLPGAITDGMTPYDSEFVYVPGTRADRALLVAHSDTVWCYDGYEMANPLPVFNNFVVHGGVVFPGNNAPGLGADDRAGCAILYELRNLGHSLLITNGEEVGCEGIKFMSMKRKDIFEEIQKHSFAVGFDRRGSKQFKCYDVGTAQFRKYLATKLPGWVEPDRMSFSDVKYLCRDLCGVNLSVGYMDEHFFTEHLYLNSWEDTLEIAKTWLSEPLQRFELVREYEFDRQLYGSFDEIDDVMESHPKPSTVSVFGSWDDTFPA